MSQSVYIRSSMTPSEAERLALAVERGVRSRSWLAGQIIRQWLDDPKRKLPQEVRPGTEGMTLEQRQQATYRLKIVERWNKARIAGRRRGDSVQTISRRFAASLPEGDRVCAATLYNWYLRHQARGLRGLVDGRSNRVQTPCR